MGVLITNVMKNTPSFKAGISAGDELLSIGGNSINDVLDYMYYSAEAFVEVSVMRENRRLNFHIEKGEYDDLGLEFESFLMSKQQSCSNKCIFCFIDQMPPNMRETLYFKDDDSRLSFLQGNYVTLTNMKQEEIDRIISMKLYVNVSVHTTNPELRCFMMNNRFAGEKLAYLKQFADAGIAMNCQIVLCPGINDGEELVRTLTDLGKLMPNIKSIAVVPVGVTKFRDGLYKLKLHDFESANAAIDIIERFQEEFLSKYGSRMVFGSDEFYITAKRKLPSFNSYEEFSQFENGIGMMRSLIDEFCDALEDAIESEISENIPSCSIATGYIAYDFIAELVEKTKAKFPKLDCDVYRIRNDFFGETITVTGLITGGDLIGQLRGKKLGEYLLLSSDMIRKGEDVFLDDVTISDVESALNVKIILTKNDGYDLFDKIVGIGR